MVLRLRRLRGSGIGRDSFGRMSPSTDSATLPGSGGSLLGTRVLRTEDPRLLTGVARYIPDLQFDDLLHAVFVRSEVAHGTIRSIDTAEAAAMPGVVAVWTADDLDIAPHHGFVKIHDDFARPPLAAIVCDSSVSRWRWCSPSRASRPPTRQPRCTSRSTSCRPSSTPRRRLPTVPRGCTTAAPTTSPSPSRPTSRSTSRRCPTSLSAADTSTSASRSARWKRTASRLRPAPTARSRSGRRIRCRTTRTARSPVCSGSTRPPCI